MRTVDLTALLSALKDVALGLAAIVTATVAVRGLRRWREELRGKADFEVARGLVRATYKLRDEIQSCRLPLMRVAVRPPKEAEFPADQIHQDPLDALAKAELEAWTRAYKDRWQPVLTALQEFDAQALEAEALWGSEIRKDTQELRRCAHTVFVAIEAILEDKAAGGDHFKHDAEFGRLMRANAHAPPSATDNELTNQVAAAVSVLESKLRGHLTRPR
jgi:hypothetical protein